MPKWLIGIKIKLLINPIIEKAPADEEDDRTLLVYVNNLKDGLKQNLEFGKTDKSKFLGEGCCEDLSGLNKQRLACYKPPYSK